MQKLLIQKINEYDYILINEKKEEIQLNIEFYSKYKPQVNDVIYVDDSILKETNLYTFGEITAARNIDIKDIVKVISNGKEYYFQRIYG